VGLHQLHHGVLLTEVQARRALVGEFLKSQLVAERGAGDHIACLLEPAREWTTRVDPFKWSLPLISNRRPLNPRERPPHCSSTGREVSKPRPFEGSCPLGDSAVAERPD